MDRSRLQQLEQLLVSYLDLALKMELRLSEDESAYDLRYIGEKLSKCSSYLEKLSDIQLNITKITLEVTVQYSAAKNLLELKQDQAHEEFSSMEEAGGRYRREEYVRKQTVDLDGNFRLWEQVRTTAKTVAEAISKRAQDFKRLDSDIRLQQRLLEAKITAGAVSSPHVAGKDAVDLDLD